MAADPVIIETTSNLTKIIVKTLIPFILIAGFISIILRLLIDSLLNKADRFRSSLKSGLKKSNRCPYCGGFLVEKSGQYGRFLGCSNYPKCHFTKKL